MDISIIIVSWRVRELLKKCLASIYKENINLDFEVFVVDNASGDGTVEMINSNFPQISLIANSANFGFAFACNQAIKKSTGNFILLLNPDTEIIDDAIGKTVDFMKQSTEVGVAGCKIIGENGDIQPSVRSFPNLISHMIILLKLHHFLKNNKSLGSYYMKNFDYEATQRVDQVMGSFFMIRRELFQKIGLLDEHFFIWYEEVDFCQRVLKMGWTTYYFSGASVLHQKGRSFIQRAPLFLQLVFDRSMLRYFYKHRPKYEYFVLLLIFPFSIILSLLVQLGNLKRQKHEY